jgi:hypothetical protein
MSYSKEKAFGCAKRASEAFEIKRKRLSVREEANYLKALQDPYELRKPITQRS